MLMVEPLERPLSSYIHTQFVTADENSSVAEAVKILQSKDVEIILVISNGKYVGRVTDSDILEKVVIKGEDSDLVFLKSIMSIPLITLPSSSTVKQTIQLMRPHKIKHLPVTNSTNNNDNDKDKIIGTVTQQYLAEVIRIAVIEKTFRSYRKIIREYYKPIFANVAITLQFSGLLMVIPALLDTVGGN
jgi:trk system potassium uptake protein